MIALGFPRRHPETGELTLGYQVMQLLGTPGQHLITYVADTGTSDHDKLVPLDMLATSQSAAPDTVVPGHSRSEHPRK